MSAKNMSLDMFVSMHPPTYCTLVHLYVVLMSAGQWYVISMLRTGGTACYTGSLGPTSGRHVDNRCTQAAPHTTMAHVHVHPPTELRSSIGMTDGVKCTKPWKL